jgi:hypothetical protein
MSIDFSITDFKSSSKDARNALLNSDDSRPIPYHGQTSSEPIFNPPRLMIFNNESKLPYLDEEGSYQLVKTSVIDGEEISDSFVEKHFPQTINFDLKKGDGEDPKLAKLWSCTEANYLEIENYDRILFSPSTTGALGNNIAKIGSSFILQNRWDFLMPTTDENYVYFSGSNYKWIFPSGEMEFEYLDYDGLWHSHQASRQTSLSPFNILQVLDPISPGSHSLGSLTLENGQLNFTSQTTADHGVLSGLYCTIPGAGFILPLGQYLLEVNETHHGQPLFSVLGETFFSSVSTDANGVDKVDLSSDPIFTAMVNVSAPPPPPPGFTLDPIPVPGNYYLKNLTYMGGSGTVENYTLGSTPFKDLFYRGISVLELSTHISESGTVGEIFFPGADLSIDFTYQQNTIDLSETSFFSTQIQISRENPSLCINHMVGDVMLGDFDVYYAPGISATEPNIGSYFDDRLSSTKFYSLYCSWNDSEKVPVSQLVYGEPSFPVLYVADISCSFGEVFSNVRLSDLVFYVTGEDDEFIKLYSPLISTNDLPISMAIYVSGQISSSAILSKIKDSSEIHRSILDLPIHEIFTGKRYSIIRVKKHTEVSLYDFFGDLHNFGYVAPHRGGTYLESSSQGNTCLLELGNIGVAYTIGNHDVSRFGENENPNPENFDIKNYYFPLLDRIFKDRLKITEENINDEYFNDVETRIVQTFLPIRSTTKRIVRSLLNSSLLSITMPSNSIGISFMMNAEYFEKINERYNNIILVETKKTMFEPSAYLLLEDKDVKNHMKKFEKISFGTYDGERYTAFLNGLKILLCASYQIEKESIMAVPQENNSFLFYYKRHVKNGEPKNIDFVQIIWRETKLITLFSEQKLDISTEQFGDDEMMRIIRTGIEEYMPIKAGKLITISSEGKFVKESYQVSDNDETLENLTVNTEWRKKLDSTNPGDNQEEVKLFGVNKSKVSHMGNTFMRKVLETNIDIFVSGKYKYVIYFGDMNFSYVELPEGQKEYLGNAAYEYNGDETQKYVDFETHRNIIGSLPAKKPSLTEEPVDPLKFESGDIPDQDRQKLQDQLGDGEQVTIPQNIVDKLLSSKKIDLPVGTVVKAIYKSNGEIELEFETLSGGSPQYFMVDGKIQVAKQNLKLELACGLHKHPAPTGVFWVIFKLPKEIDIQIANEIMSALISNNSEHIFNYYRYIEGRDRIGLIFDYSTLILYGYSDVSDESPENYRYLSLPLYPSARVSLSNFNIEFENPSKHMQLIPNIEIPNAVIRGYTSPIFYPIRKSTPHKQSYLTIRWDVPHPIKTIQLDLREIDGRYVSYVFMTVFGVIMDQTVRANLEGENVLTGRTYPGSSFSMFSYQKSYDPQTQKTSLLWRCLTDFFTLYFKQKTPTNLGNLEYLFNNTRFTIEEKYVFSTS